MRGDVHTNTVEGFFSLLKGGVNGTFHHVSTEHLHRYHDEFVFRYENRKVSDGKRAQPSSPTLKASASPTNSQREEARKWRALWDARRLRNRPRR